MQAGSLNLKMLLRFLKDDLKVFMLYMINSMQTMQSLFT